MRNCSAYLILSTKVEIHDNTIPLDRIDHFANRLTNRLNLYGIHPKVEGWSINISAPKLNYKIKLLSISNESNSALIMPIEILIFMNNVDAMDIIAPSQQIMKDYSDNTVIKVTGIRAFSEKSSAYNALSTRGYLVESTERVDSPVKLQDLDTPLPNAPSKIATAMFGYKILSENESGVLIGEKIVGCITIRPTISTIERFLSQTEHSLKSIWRSERMGESLAVLAREAGIEC